MNTDDYTHLSTLKNADEDCITYYVGDDPEDIKHLRNCLLICNKDLNIPNNLQIAVHRSENPKLDFYRISAKFKKDYLESGKLEYDPVNRSYIHPEAQIGENVSIGPGCVIGNCIIEDNVRIDANVVIYAETHIENNCIIESNTNLGASGVMWVWDKNERVYLEQLGNVRIEENCFLGCNVEISRGSANETATIGKNTCIAHGSKLGHGCMIGAFNHFSNNVTFGGSVETGDRCFFGCGVTVAPGSKLGDDIIAGTGAVVVKDIQEKGIYIGLPARKMKETKGKNRGIPRWRI